MTLVGYFNSMRELSGMRRLVDDDVRLRLQSADARGLAKRTIRPPEELTSRRSSADIPRILDRLETVFDPAQDKLRRAGKSRNAAIPLDVLLATNMISVGVDVSRLGSMVVAGQPKTTAEYIQATSRVGRSSPGLVCTVFNWARARDLSHYERFEHYHATFYPIVRRAEEVNGTKEAGEEVRAMLVRRIDEWRARADSTTGGSRLGYKDRKDGVTRGLLRTPDLGEWDNFTCLNSLRDVEPTVGLILSDHGIDDEAPATAEGVGS